MTLSRIQKFGVAASFALATIFGAATQAQALDVGQCGTPTVMTEALKAEGQRSLITGDRLVVNNTDPVQIFTSNSSGQGYLLEGDQPSGTISSKFCVALKYQDFKLFDSRRAEMPNSILVGGGQHDQAMRSGYANGNRVMMQATSLLNNRPSSLLTLGNNSQLQAGSMLFTDANHNVRITATMENLKFTDAALAILDAPVQTASLAMK